MTLSDSVELNNGIAMPRLGLGVWQVDDAIVEETVLAAFDCGYRAVDTARIYDNEAGVGRALRATPLPREEIFVTTKLWNTDQGASTSLDAFERSLDLLGQDYVDLYLIHWPKPQAGLFVETWEVLERILESGRTRAIGVSNFEPEHLMELIDRGLTVPAVNQIECHPYLQQRDLHAIHAKYEIATTAWSPLAQGEVLADPVIVEIAGRHGVTPAQVVIAWHLQSGNIVIPKTITPARLQENFSARDVRLTEDDMTAMAGLDRNGRQGPHPNFTDF